MPPKSLVTVFATAAILCAHPTQGAGAGAGADWTELADWIGKYPSDKSVHHGSQMLDDTPLKAQLKKLLPKAEWAALNQFDTETPVRQMGDYLVVNKCRPHNCPADFAMVVIDPKNQKLWIGLFTREDAHVSTRWYANADDYSVLPDEIKKDFLARHGD